VWQGTKRLNIDLLQEDRREIPVCGAVGNNVTFTVVTVSL